MTVSLHTERVAGEQIERGPQDTLDTIKRNVEGGADPVAPNPTQERATGGVSPKPLAC